MVRAKKRDFIGEFADIVTERIKTSQ